jgi:hypothetical protein
MSALNASDDRGWAMKMCVPRTNAAKTLVMLDAVTAGEAGSLLSDVYSFGAVSV